MKKISFYIFLLLSIYCCGKKDEEPKPSYSIFGLKNGVEWKASSDMIKESDLLSFSAHVFNEYGDRREHLGIANIPNRVGKYPIYFNQSLYNRDSLYSMFYTLIYDGDVLDGVYMVCGSENNFYEIKEIDSKNRIVKGEFQVTFIQDTASKPRNPSLLDTIRFTECTFTTTYVLKSNNHSSFQKLLVAK